MICIQLHGGAFSFFYLLKHIKPPLTLIVYLYKQHPVEGYLIPRAVDYCQYLVVLRRQRIKGGTCAAA